MKLKNELTKEKKMNFFYLLKKDMEIKMGEENSFLVKNTFKQNPPLCSCKKVADTVIFPCLHIATCFECFKDKKYEKCPFSGCGKKVKEITRLIDIYRPAD